MRKKKKLPVANKKHIVQTSNDTFQNHRRDFETCPHCSHKMDSDEWEKIASVLVLNPKCYRAGCVAIISECPKCFESSWVHEQMRSFLYLDSWPSDWKDSVINLEKYVKLKSLRDWG